MTDDERHIKQGRARDEAKKLEAEVATLKAFLLDYIERLEGAKNAISRFLSDPFAKLGDGFPIVDLVNRRHRELCVPGFWEAATDFVDKSRKLRELEEQIKKF